jgi:hypothetical protein
MEMLLSQEDSSWKPPIKIPQNLFVFANYYFEHVYFFVADGLSENPPIFFAESAQSSGKIFEYRQAGDSIWSFVEDCLKDFEANY